MITYYCTQNKDDDKLIDLLSLLTQKYNLELQIRTPSDSCQTDFLLDVHKDLAVIVDATIPEDLTIPTIYPLLTAHVNIFNHVILFSRALDDEGNEILPLNITPPRKRCVKDTNLQQWIEEQLVDIISHNGYYPRLNVNSINELAHQRNQMEQMIRDALALSSRNRGEKPSIFISYRNKYIKEVYQLKEIAEQTQNVEIQVLPPGSLCGDYEAHTPMRRWMLVGLLDDFIRNVEEVWVYLTEDYMESWWTISEILMTAYINHKRPHDKKIKLKVYNPSLGRFLTKDEYPCYLSLKFSDEHYRKLARYLSNTRPETMGPEIRQKIHLLRNIAEILRRIPNHISNDMLDNLKQVLSLSIPTDLPTEQKEQMLTELLSLYTNPDELEKYASDPVHNDDFWDNISFQVDKKTPSFVKNEVDIDLFMKTPEKEMTLYKEQDLVDICNKNGDLILSGQHGKEVYKISHGKSRYLWLATRYMQPTIKDAPGLEVLRTFNIKPKNPI